MITSVGLMLKDKKDDKYSVPWKTITTEIQLCDGASPKYNYTSAGHATTHG